MDAKNIDTCLERVDMCRQNIPVVWGADKKYILQAFVVMRTILLHSKEKYHFFILTSDYIDEEVREVTEILSKEYDNFKISVKVIDPTCFEKAQICNTHLSKAAYFRLLIPELIQEYDKCIYLDCDIIVHGDLKELYEIELGNNYLAGVKDCHIIADTSRERQHQRILGLPTRAQYINSGVLVMGLKRLRRDKMVPLFMEQLKEENWYEDQDVLNACCYPFIKTIPLKYNLFHFYLGTSIKFLYELPYGRQDFDFDHDVPYILHIGGAFKAWDDFHVKGAREWWKSAEIFSASKSYQYYWQKCQQDTMNNDWLSEMIIRAKESKRIIIWGYSQNGKRLCDILLEYQLDHLEAFVDNNRSVWNQTYQGVPVKGVQSIDRDGDSILWIVSCQMSYAEVIRQLRDNGVSEKDIIHYKEPFIDHLYLLSRDISAYNSMVSGIAEREYIRKFPDRHDREQYIKDIMNNPLQYDTEYTYLAEKYSFKYWLETWQEERLENEDNSYHSMSE